MDEQHPQSRYRIATLVMIAVVSVHGMWATLSSVFNCVPVQKFWNEDHPGTCLPRQSFW